MVIIKIWGGIGNQLFQYVFGQYIKHRFNQDVFYDNNSYLITDKQRKDELSVIDNKINYNNNNVFSQYYGIKNRFYRYCFQINPKNHFITESSYVLKPIDRFKKNHIYFFQGYWQDIKFYKWLLDNVLDFKIHCLNIPNKLTDIREQIINSSNSVSLHVRRGDYFNKQNIKTYGVCDSNYFKLALDNIKEKKDLTVFIFSDDIEWVKNNLDISFKKVFIPNYDVDQFAYIELMSLCKTHIISNSSFSWWGAVLNAKDDTQVICPKRWTLTSNKTIALEIWTQL